ncbi:hypothetical protein FMM68_10975 [Lachnospiraceae bacterium MD329]|nr:hypothetical protein [Lachnospiraceae bacterium MD329]
MEEILERFKKAIIYKLDEMSILNSAVRPSADEFYKMACVIKMCSEIKNIEFLKEKEIATNTVIEKMIADFHNGRGLK